MVETYPCLALGATVNPSAGGATGKLQDLVFGDTERTRPLPIDFPHRQSDTTNNVIAVDSLSGGSGGGGFCRGMERGGGD